MNALLSATNPQWLFVELTDTCSTSFLALNSEQQGGGLNQAYEFSWSEGPEMLDRTVLHQKTLKMAVSKLVNWTFA